MPKDWLAVPYTDQATGKRLSEQFEVEGIPTLVILDAVTGATITEAGTAAVVSDPQGHR